MKIATIHVNCCRECPFSEKGDYYNYAYCAQIDKTVEANEIDKDCPLDDGNA